MAEEFVTRREHDEFKERLEEDSRRKNKRLDLLENTVQQINNLTLSVEKLATNMENMLLNQRKQERQLEELEKQDGERWRQATGYIITTLIGATLGFCLKHIGL